MSFGLRAIKGNQLEKQRNVYDIVDSESKSSIKNTLNINNMIKISFFCFYNIIESLRLKIQLSFLPHKLQYLKTQACMFNDLKNISQLILKLNISETF